MTQAGKVNLKPTYFLQKTRTAPTASKILRDITMGAAKALTVTASNAGTVVTAPGAGWYRVQYTWENKYGETLAINSGQPFVTATNTPAAYTVSASQTIRMTLSGPDATAADNAEYLNLFVSEPAASEALAEAATCYWVQRLPLTNAGQTFDWDGKRLPNTYTAFIGQNTSDVLTFRQLAPLVKMDLATIAPAYKWMILLYGMPIIFVPQKWTRVINIRL
jgi:hypothetical protein